MNLTKSNAYRNLFLLLLLNIFLVFNSAAQTQITPCSGAPQPVTWMSAYVYPVCPMKNGSISITIPASVSGPFRITLMYRSNDKPHDALQPYEGGRIIQSTKTAGTSVTYVFDNLDPNYYCFLIETNQGCYNNDVQLFCCVPTKVQWTEAKRHPLCELKNGMIQYRLSNNPAINNGVQLFGQVRLTLMYRKLGTNDPLKPYPGAQVYMQDFGSTQENKMMTVFPTFNNLEPNYYCAIIQTYQGCYNIDIELDCEKIPVCTYTQGAWGSAGGKMSDGVTSKKWATEELINTSIAHWGGTLRIGSQTPGGRSLTITEAKQVLDFLPNGGPSVVLNHSGELPLDKFLSTYNLKKGGSLIAQTIALGLNLKINKPEQQHLGFVPLQGIVSSTVINKLTDKTVGGLYNFANVVIAGGSTNGLSLSDISEAVDAINNFFDECKYYRGPSQSAISVSPNVAGATATVQTEESPLKVAASPNPFRGNIRFVLESTESGQGVLEVYNVGGVKVATPFRGQVSAGVSQVVTYNSASVASSNLLYVFRVNGKQTTGKLIAAK